MSDDDFGTQKHRVDINRPFLDLLNKVLPVIYANEVNVENDPHSLWSPLKTLVDSMPRDMYNDLEPETKQINTQLEAIRRSNKIKPFYLNIKGLKPVRSVIGNIVDRNRDYERRKAIRGLEQIYLRSVMRTFYRLVFTTLDEHGYLEMTRGYGDIPTTNMRL
jgi:hypothetical protein